MLATFPSFLLCLAFSCTPTTQHATRAPSGHRVESVKINIPQDEITHFRQMLTLTRLPDVPIIPGADEDLSYGTSLADLKDAKDRLLRFNWRRFEADMNRFRHYSVEIESTNIHFVHERSRRPDAIPLLLLHGWPFSFTEYRYVIEPLINPPPGQQAFHVVVPSLPGIFLSSIVPDINHSTPDVARIFNTLMVDVLGYNTYGAEGGDFGAINLRQVQLNHADHCRLLLFTGFPAPRPANFTDEDMDNMTEVDKQMFFNREMFFRFGTAYLQEQVSEVATIGYATYDGIGFLSWVAGKYQAIIRTGNVAPERVDQVWTDLLTNVLMYQYTHSSHTSMLMYKQSGTEHIFDAFGRQPNSTGAPMGAVYFDGEIFLAPQPFIADAGNLIYYKHRPEGGGHWPAVIVPESWVEEVRYFYSTYWSAHSQV
ncbi:hypothetical protein ONZ45_g11640 [Pleurotus djamor]|nr:hypothetical protein ONZ45_g11640 [Pleurotus djamor]